MPMISETNEVEALAMELIAAVCAVPPIRSREFLKSKNVHSRALQIRIMERSIQVLREAHE